MPDAATALQILSGAISPPAPVAPPVAAPSAPLPGAPSPQGQGDTANGAADPSSLGDKLSVIAAGAQGKLPPAPPQEPPASLGSVGSNFLGGVNSGLWKILGAPADLAGHALNPWGGGTPGDPRGGMGRPFDQLSPDQQAWAQRYPDTYAFLRNWTQGAEHPMLGSDWIRQKYADLTGYDTAQIQPQNTAERVAQSAGGATTQALATVLGARALALPEAATATPLARGDLIQSMARAPLPTTAISAAAGGGAGQALQDALPDQYKAAGPTVNLLGNLGVGGLTAAGLQGARLLAGTAWDRLAPFFAAVSPSVRADLAGQKLASSATDPKAALASLSDEGSAGELVPGSQPTTYQATADPGLGRLERAQATKDSAAFIARREAQNAARVDALEGVAPEGAQSGVVGNYLQQRAADTDAQTQGIYDAALQRAQLRAQALGGNGTDDQYGNIMRDELASAKASAKASESAAWSAIDPRNSLNIDVTPTKTALKSVLDAVPEDARQPTGAEADIYGKINGWPDVREFRNFAAVRGDLLAAIREERMNGAGETPALRRMQQVRASMDNTIAGAGTAAQAAEGAAAQSPVAAADAAGTAVAAPSAGSGVFTPSGRNVGVRYEVVEGKNLVPSNGPDLEPNPAYPPELQPRDRSRVASEAQIAKMSGNLQPERLGASNEAGTGAPIVGPDGVVESGNARALAIQRAYEQNGKSAQAYRDYLTQQGYNVEGMEQPVLIRRRTTDLSPTERIRFTQEANASPTLAMSATERAAVDAQRLKPDALALYKGGDVGSAENRPFVRAFAQSVLDPTETGSFATAGGALSMEGKSRVENALLSRAYGNSDLVASLAETGDPNIKAFGGTLKTVAGEVARLHDSVAAGDVPAHFDISGPLSEAAALVQRARASGEPLSDLLSQRDAFNQVSPMAENIARAAFGDDLSGRLNKAKLADILRFYTEEAAKQSAGPQLFASEVTPEGILAAGGGKYGRAFEPIETGPAAAGGLAAVPPGRPGGLGPSDAAGGQTAQRPQPSAARQGASAGVAAGGQSGNASAVLPQEPLTANFDTEAAQRYRAAANATRERAQTFGTGPVGQVLRRGAGGLPYNLSDAQVAGKFFNSGARSYDNAVAYVNAVGDRPAAMAALRDYAASDLRDYAGRADGTLDPAKVSTWLDNHPSMRLFPELAENFQNAAAADRAIQLAARDRKAALVVYQRGVASKFLNGADPADAVASALSSRDPQAMRQLSALVASNQDARQGLQRAAVDLMQRRLIGNDLAGNTGSTYFKPAMFQNFLRNNRDGLAQIFSPDQLDSLDALAADLQRGNLSVSGAKLPGTPGTAQDLTAAHGGAGKSLFWRLLSAGVVGHLFETATTGAATGIGAVAGPAVLVAGALRDAGMHSVNQLVTEALLHPALARSLLTPIVDRQLPDTLRTIGNQLRVLSVIGAIPRIANGAGTSSAPPRRSSSLLAAPPPPSLLAGPRAPSLLMGQ